MTKNSGESTAIDIAKVGGAFAALSVLTVFLASLASVMYTRGLFSEMGFPASSMGVKAAADMFAVIAYQRCVLIVVVGIIGFIPAPWSKVPERVHQRILITILSATVFLLTVSVESASQSPLIRIPTGALAFILPIFVGYTFRSTQHDMQQYPKALVVCVAVIAAFSINPRLIGSGHAMRVIATGLENDKTSLEERLGKTPKDFSVVTLVSKEDLSFLTGGRKLDGGYEYAPKPEVFLRFIAEDESKYFMIENKSNQITPFIVRKETVTAMRFKTDSAVPRPIP